MHIKRTPLYFIPVAVILLLITIFAVTAGEASAKGANRDDYGIWHAQEDVGRQGGFLRPGNHQAGFIHQPQPGDNFTPDRDGFLIYFGEDEDFALDRRCKIVVISAFDDPLITVWTFYDTLRMEQFASNYFMDVDAFAADIGLEYPKGGIEMAPVGHLIARNEAGTRSSTFKPLPGDIGAYLIIVAAYSAELARRLYRCH